MKLYEFQGLCDQHFCQKIRHFDDLFDFTDKPLWYKEHFNNDSVPVGTNDSDNTVFLEQIFVFSKVLFLCFYRQALANSSKLAAAAARRPVLKVPCPGCQQQVPQAHINAHLDRCLEKVERSEEVNNKR